MTFPVLTSAEWPRRMAIARARRLTAVQRITNSLAAGSGAGAGRIVFVMEAGGGGSVDARAITPPGADLSHNTATNLALGAVTGGTIYGPMKKEGKVLRFRPAAPASFPGVANHPVHVQRRSDGLWHVEFSGNTALAKSGTITFRKDGKLNVQISDK